MTSSGITCVNGHGGADSLERPTVAAVSAREDLITRLRMNYTASNLVLTLMRQAADMLKADAQPAVPPVVLSTAMLGRIDDLAEWFTDNPNHSDIKDALTVLVRDMAGADMLEADAAPQEPVCRHCSSNQGHFEWCCSNCGAQDTLDRPPQRPRLTDEEIRTLRRGIIPLHVCAEDDDVLEFAREIEKKVRGEI